VTEFYFLARFARAAKRFLGRSQFNSLVALTTVTLVFGTLFYLRVEGWSVLDSFCFRVTEFPRIR
jgi:hypothetical protein